jgi:TolA-binding protein
VNLSRWILVSPFLLFGLSVYLLFSTENEARVLFDRAQTHWSNGRFEKAIEGYQQVCRDHPDSTFAPQALWELGQLNYVSLADIDEAISYFEQLIDKYPNHPLSVDCLLRLAEIHSLELRDWPRAIHYWDSYLEGEKDFQKRRAAQFEIANALFQMTQLDEARDAFEEVADASRIDAVTVESFLRIGTILQIKKDFQGSVEYFERAMGGREYPECRLQAQLGLIESLEFLGELPRAIEVANEINASDYSVRLKSDLVARLKEKRQYYEPSLWNRRH